MIEMLKNDDNYIFNVLLKVAIDYLKVIKVVQFAPQIDMVII